jgi:hypothetical protein
MSGTVKRRHHRERKAFYRRAALRTDKRGRSTQRYYDDQLERAKQDLMQTEIRADVDEVEAMLFAGASDPLPSQPMHQPAER